MRAAVLTLTVAAAGILPPAVGAQARFTPVTDRMLAAPDPDDWLMWRRTLGASGHSPLAEIDAGNVAGLELAWSADLGPGVSQEGTPLVYDGVLYFPHPADLTEARDAATGELIWTHRRDLPDDLGRYVPFPDTNRNLAIYGRLVIDNGADGTVYALDAATGELVWETRVLDYRTHPGKQGSAPLVAAGKLISGRNCMPEAGPDACVITAHDALTGTELWRRRTIPRPGEPGDATWRGVDDADRWHVGAWLVPSYDPELDLVYVGTSVTAPAPKFMLAGNEAAHLYHNSTLALDPDTGELAWYYQHLVDHWDLDHAYERMLVDTAVAPDPETVPWISPDLVPGETRRVVTGVPGKTGIVYTLDRATGEFLWARPTIMQNVVARIEPATGRVEVEPDARFTGPDQERFVCPSANGGKNWPAGAFDADSGIMYFPMQNTCMRTRSEASSAEPELVYALQTETVSAPGTSMIGTVRAISVETGRELWRHDQRAGVTGLLATAGGLVFGGDVGGRFRALDARTGDVLWETELGAAATGHPVTYRARGRQYIAVSTGRSNMTGSLARLTPDAAAPGNDNRLYVFALPE